MGDAFWPVIMADPTLCSPSEETQGDVLDQQSFADLYQLVKEEGLPYFTRLRADGDVELYLVFESIEEFSEATSDAVSIEFKTYQDKLLAVIWTVTDPIHPLGFPLTFDIKKETDRFMALRMLEQAAVQIHYLSFENDRITHIFTEEATFSAQETERTQGYIRRLYEGKSSNHDAEAEEVKEEPIRSIDADTLAEQVLLEKGVSYSLHYGTLANREGQEAAQNLVMGTVHQAMLVMRRHARSEVRESSFTVWVAQQEETLAVIISPALDHLFAAADTFEEGANPFSRFLQELPEFLETKDVSPLQLGAYPILRYQAGRLFHLELSEETQHHLAHLYEKERSSAANPYLPVE